MIIDAFLINDETDMASFRMKILEPYVDVFVGVECNRTFSGREKGFMYHADSFPEAKGKFVYKPLCLDMDPGDYEKPVSYDPGHPCWTIERTQRDHIVKALDAFSDEDFVLMGDVDEIPSREAMDMLTKNNFGGIATFQMFFFYYHLKCLRNEMWMGTVWCPLKALRKFGAQAIRDSRGGTGFNVERGGWHLSYFGGVDSIQKKISDFSHQEFNNPEYNTKEKISRHISAGTDLFDRNVDSRIPPDDFFPEYFKQNVPEGWI